MLVHLLAAVTVRRIGRWLFHAASDSSRTTDAASESSRTTNAEDDDDCQVQSDDAKHLLEMFLRDQLREMCRLRRLNSSGWKGALIQRILTSESRASDKQMAYMLNLLKRNHLLQVTVEDVDSSASASRWIDAAKVKQR